MAKLENQQQRELAKWVAAELGWTTGAPKNWGDPETAPFLMLGPNGEALWINTEWNDSSKVHVSGEYPKGPKGEDLTPYNASKPSISVSFNRGYAVIAKEIRRRLLPDYTALMQTMQARRDSSIEYLNNISDAASKLSAVLGGLVKPQTNNNREPVEGALTSAYVPNRSFSFDLACSNDNSISIKMSSVPMDLALTLAQVIRAYYATP